MGKNELISILAGAAISMSLAGIAFPLISKGIETGSINTLKAEIESIIANADFNRKVNDSKVGDELNIYDANFLTKIEEVNEDKFKYVSNLTKTKYTNVIYNGEYSTIEFSINNDSLKNVEDSSIINNSCNKTLIKLDNKITCEFINKKN